MNSVCSICGREFETHDKRKRYCSRECARQAKLNQNNNWNKVEREEKRIEWAYQEADKLSEIVITTGGSYMDMLADYIYNNYNKRGETNGE